MKNANFTEFDKDAPYKVIGLPAQQRGVKDKGGIKRYLYV